MTTTHDQVLQRIAWEREQWRMLLDEIGESRMDEPGPMGAWSFKDLVVHLGGWRERAIRRLEAPPGTEPATPWPAHLTDADYDAINTWIHEHGRDRTLQEVLAEAEQSFERLIAAIRALPEVDLQSPGRFPWLEGQALAQADLFGHFHDEHESAVRHWLAGHRRS